jgi:ATP-dependent Zn protease
MNRFFRSGLLPLILIVLVVYLASSQLMGGNKNEKKVTLSQFQTEVQGGQVREAVFNPNKQSISFKLEDGTKGTVHYPSEQSVPGLQRQLDEHNVQYDSKGVGTSA